MVVMFDSEESYRANADNPVQHSAFLTLRACLDQDPEWNDVAHVLRLTSDD